MAARRKPGQTQKESYFSIGVMAQVLGVNTQRIRLLEKEGFLQPRRTEGKTRLYTQDDLEKARVVLTLMDELGVNAAGVEIILRLRGQIEQMQEEMRRLLGEVLQHMDNEEVFSKNALVVRSERGLSRVPHPVERTPKP